MWTGLIRLPFVRPDMSDEVRDGEETTEVEEAEETARAYYGAIDARNYDRFAGLLAPGVVHERPDRTIEGRETLVEFMRDGRPNEDTSHRIRGVFRGADGSDDVAVEGRLLDSDGELMFAFLDVFAVEKGEGGRIEEIRTYTR
jgi:ketosteroid isomerase-like protein